MNRLLQALSISAIGAVSIMSINATAAVPAGYYDSLEGKTGVELKKAVKAIAKDHKVLRYGESTEGNAFAPAETGSWTVFAESDVRMVDGHLCWWDMYSSNNLWVSDGHPGLNIEHSVANSWWGGQSGSKEAYNDLHHLNPSNGEANGQKSNWPLGEISGTPYWTNGVTTTGTPKEGTGDGATRVFQPHDAYKGDFARAYFYVFTIYDDINWKDDSNWMYDKTSDLLLKEWARKMLLEWSKSDPVSRKESDRNDKIFQYQENRNPFIDCPQLADYIWGDKQGQPFHYTLSTPEEDNPEDYPGWDETFPDLVSGQWVPVTSDEELLGDYDFFIVSPTTNRAMTYTLISTGKAIDECLYSPEHSLLTYPDVLTSVPEEIATVRLENEGSDWYVGVYDPEKKFKGYISVSSKNTAVLSQTKTASTKAAVTVDAANNKTVITYTLNDGPYTLQYNKGNPRFAAYSSTQNPIQLYRASDEILSDPEPQPGAGIGATGIDENAPETIIGIYDINGRKVNATSTEGLDKGIYIVVSNFGTKKIRK